MAKQFYAHFYGRETTINRYTIMLTKDEYDKLNALPDDEKLDYLTSLEFSKMPGEEYDRGITEDKCLEVDGMEPTEFEGAYEYDS